MKIRDNVELRKLSEDVFLIEINGQDCTNDCSKIITFNKTAAIVWNSIIDIDFDENTIADLLTNRYRIDYDQALTDAKELIRKWTDAGLAC